MDPRFTSLSIDPRFKRKRKAKKQLDPRFATIDDNDSGFGKDLVSSLKTDKFGRPTSVLTQLKNRGNKYNNLNHKQHLSLKKDTKESLGKERQSIKKRKKEEENERNEEEAESLKQKEISDDDSAFSSDQDLDFNLDDKENDDDDDDDEIDEDAWSDSAFSMDQDASLLDEVLDRSSVPSGQPTSRLALVNMDWDHFTPMHVFKLMDSLKPPGSQIVSVQLYVSEFGKQKLAYEELHGPDFSSSSSLLVKSKKSLLTSSESSSTWEKEPQQQHQQQQSPENVKTKATLLNPSQNHSASENEWNEDNEEDDGSNSLYHQPVRRYALEKLRYYYMVIVCDTVMTSQHLVKEGDGVEFEKTSNVLDLRYIPNDMILDSKDLISEVNQSPIEYTPFHHFETKALQHTKVECTWDDFNPRASTSAFDFLTLNASTKNKKKNQKLKDFNLNQIDYTAYLASDHSSDSDSFISETEGSLSSTTLTKKTEPTKKKEKKQKHKQKQDIEIYRSLLGLPPLSSTSTSSSENEEEKKETTTSSSHESDESEQEVIEGDMEMTFDLEEDPVEQAKALLEAREKKKQREQESTLETYQRKLKERNLKKKEKKLVLQQEERAFKETTSSKFKNKLKESEDEENEDEDLFFSNTLADDSFFNSSKHKVSVKEDMEEEDEELDDPFLTTMTPSSNPLSSSSSFKDQKKKKENEKTKKKSQETKKENEKKKTKHLDLDQDEHAKIKLHPRLQKEDPEELKECLEKGTTSHSSLNMNDPRFQAVFQDYDYAIDPTHPQFKNSSHMQSLLSLHRERYASNTTTTTTTTTTTSLTNQPSSSTLMNEPPKRESPLSSTHHGPSSLQALAQSIQSKSKQWKSSMEQGLGRRALTSSTTSLQHSTKKK